MKVLGIVCTPRVGGNSEILVQQALAGVKEAGGESEIIFIRDKNIHPCDGCLTCSGTGICHFKDDMEEISEKLVACDGMIIGAPTYWIICGLGVNFLDRVLPLAGAGKLANKLGAGIAVGAGMAVDSAVLMPLRRFFDYSNIISMGCIGAYARKPGDIKQKEHAMKSAWELGRLMVAFSKEGNKFPQEYVCPFHKAVAKKYDIAVVY
jgi:multimeric flavodoxin WrbA